MGRDQRKQTEYARAWNYGMTVAEFRAFVEKHGNRCGICGKPGDPEARGGGLVLDHDHSCCHIQSPRERRESYQPMRRTCGKCNRGLLCVACNAGLGQFGEDPDRLMAAIEYLNRWKGDTQ